MDAWFVPMYTVIMQAQSPSLSKNNFYSFCVFRKETWASSVSVSLLGRFGAMAGLSVIQLPDTALKRGS
jgi:hypothetical protein